MTQILRPNGDDKHKLLKGDDLHGARAFNDPNTTGISNPRNAAGGNLLPTIIGEFYFDPNQETLYLADSPLLQTNWLVVRDAPQIATATALFSTPSLVDVLVTGMSIAGREGTALAIFSGSASGSSAATSVFVSIYLNGVQIAHSEQTIGATNQATPFSCLALPAVVTEGDLIEGRVRSSGPGTADLLQRSLYVLRLT